MYARFTDRARKVMQLANVEAQRSVHKHLGTEHILLGLVKEGSGVAANVLKTLDIDMHKIRLQVEKLVPTYSETVSIGKMPQTLRSKKVVEYSIEEARNLNHNYVGTEHLLLGLLREREGVAAQVLLNLGLKLEDVRNGVLETLGQNMAIVESSVPPQSDVPLSVGGDSMSSAIAPPIQAVSATLAVGPTPRRWTRAEYYQMGEMGLFHGQRVELIEGEVMVLSPQNWPHTSTVDRVGEVLRLALGIGFWTRLQFPLDLGTSDPEPDVSVVTGRREDYSDHPTTAVLVVEVSESSLDYDRTRKASLYARAGIADYWIVNLVNNQVEVRRDPRPDPSQYYGHGYASVTVLVPPAVVNPLAAPQVSLAVADLLP